MAYNAKYSSCNDFEFLASALGEFCRELYKDSKDKSIITTPVIRRFYELEGFPYHCTISTEKIYKKYKKNYNIKFIPFSIVIMYYNVLNWVESLNNPVNVEEWVYMVRDFVEYSMLMKKMYFIYDSVEIGDINQDESKTIINLKTRYMSVEIIIDKTKINNPLSQNIALSIMLHDDEEFVTLIKINVKDNKDELISTFDFVSDENINIKELSDDILLNNVMREVNREIIDYFKRSLNDMFHLITDQLYYYDIEEIIGHGLWISKD